MAGVVAGLLTSATVGIAKNKLGSAIAEQGNLLWNFHDHLKDMERVLETISAVVEDAERRSVEEKSVRLLLKRLKDAALDISDMLQDYYDASEEAAAKTPRVLSSCLPMVYNKIGMANKMKSMRDKLRKISEEFNLFGFTNVTTNTVDQHYDKRETSSYMSEEKTIGRDGEKQQIIDLLSTNTNNNETLIAPIYGLGGMGKSTLAQLVYHSTQLKKYDHRIWVYVSQDFNLNKIGSNIICQLPSITGGQENTGTLENINRCLANQLDGKKVLVVLDDIWEEKKTELDRLKNMLRVQGSMIDVIVTTRKEDIARKIGTCEPYKLRPLKDDICWEIIMSFCNFEDKPNQEILKQIGMDIAKKCGGVALAARALGFMLQSVDDISGWTEINNSAIWKEPSNDNDVLPSLKLSYERMPPQLRICFSYCAIFSKGHNIAEDDLVHQWIALDFIEPSKGKDYIKQLLGMSFLQVSKLPQASQQHVVQYTMHDLVHHLAILTMADCFAVFDAAPKRNTHDLKYCRYLLLRKYDGATKLANFLPSKMRAIHFSDCGELHIPRGAFSFAKRLHTLDFSECSGILLPSSVGQLKQLRCLIAPRMQNESLPECITKLLKLQYLNINGSSKITELPESIGKLGSLEYLRLSGCSGISKLPESFGEFKCMVHLDMSGCSRLRELPDSLGNLTHLQHLELSRCSSIKVVPESLCGLTQLQYLNLSSCSRLEGLPAGVGSLIGIQHLNMSGCEQIRELPESLMKLQCLLHLDLSECMSLRRGSLAFLRGLTALQHLDISYLWCADYNDLSDDLRNLNNLKYLSLRAKKLRCCDFIATLTNLEHLDLSYNFELTNLPESIGNLKRLHTLDLSNCVHLMFLPESIGTVGLKSLVLDECSDALLDQASSLVNYSQILPMFKVSADEVKGCSNLHLLQGIHVSELRIYSLENVMSLEEATKANLSGKYNLSELTLAWSSKRVVDILKDKDLLKQLLPPTGLKSLCLQGYSCTSFPGWLTDISCHLPNLVSIDLCDLPMCSNLPPLGQLPNLEHLRLWMLPSIKKIDLEFCGGKGAFRQLSSFTMSEMKGLEEWSTTYSVEDGVEKFMFPALDRLAIQHCPRLRLKPCPPTFRECSIRSSDQVISSLEELDKTRHHCSSSSPAIKLDLHTLENSCRLFHHFPALRELAIMGLKLTSVPESVRHLTSLESLRLDFCQCISALPEWLGELSSLRSLVISDCYGIKSLPACIQQLTKLEKLEIRCNKELKEWCESEENKATTLAHIKDQLFE